MRVSVRLSFTVPPFLAKFHRAGSSVLHDDHLGIAFGLLLAPSAATETARTLTLLAILFGRISFFWVYVFEAATATCAEVNATNEALETGNSSRVRVARRAVANKKAPLEDAFEEWKANYDDGES